MISKKLLLNEGDNILGRRSKNDLLFEEILLITKENLLKY